MNDSSVSTESEIPLPRLCYDIAYYILPIFVNEFLDQLLQICETRPDKAGECLYELACQRRGLAPEPEVAKQFCWHADTLADGRKVLTLAYPEPPPVQLDVESFPTAEGRVILAPHFSALVLDEDDPPAHYILGQAPFGGGTTLRMFMDENSHCNLGPGPAPTLENFHGVLASGPGKPR